MNYKKHYDLLIEKAKTRIYEGYTEKHHIVPRCIGGTDHSDNIVKLFPEEHYVAHQLLVKMYPNNKKLLHAAIMMIPSSEKCYQRNNKLYGWLRKKYSDQRKKDMTGKNNPGYGKKWFYCPSTLQAIKVSPGSEPEGFLPGRTPAFRKRHCKMCEVYVDTVSARNTKEKYCKECKKTNRNNDYKHDYDLIGRVYNESKTSGKGLQSIAEKHGINKWSIYDYVARYKDRLEKEYGV